VGFSRAESKATGRPPYSPSDLLKLYVYGYLNKVRSSRFVGTTDASEYRSDLVAAQATARF